MLMTKPVIGIGTATVLFLGALGIAQTAQGGDRFTYVAANASKAGPSGEGRFQITVNQWSSETERDRLLAFLKEYGPDKLPEAFRSGPAVGYIYWPGHLEYTIRFASRTPSPDGGEDVVLATDYPVNLWWDPAFPAPQDFSHGTLIQLHLNKEGRGEGKLSVSTRVVASRDWKTFVLEDYAKQAALLTDVRREQNF